MVLVSMLFTSFLHFHFFRKHGLYRIVKLIWGNTEPNVLWHGQILTVNVCLCTVTKHNKVRNTNKKQSQITPTLDSHFSFSSAQFASVSCPKLLFLENPFEFIWNLKSSFEISHFKLNLKIVYSIWKCIQNMNLEGEVRCVFNHIKWKLEYTHMAPLPRVLFWNELKNDLKDTFRFQKNIWDFE